MQVALLAAVCRKAERLIKFFGVSLVCGVLDAALGMLCLNYFNLSLAWSTCYGFAGGFFCGYFSHEIWTFASGKLFRLSSFLKYAASSAALFGFRLAIVQVEVFCMDYFGIDGDVSKNIAFIAMLGLSFALNYLLCRFIVFAS